MQLSWFNVTVKNGGDGKPFTRKVYASSQSAAKVVLGELPAHLRGQHPTVEPTEAPVKVKPVVSKGLPMLTEAQKPAWMKASA